jgi:hypothetical protein
MASTNTMRKIRERFLSSINTLLSPSQISGARGLDALFGMRHRAVLLREGELYTADYGDDEESKCTLLETDVIVGYPNDDNMVFVATREGVLKCYTDGDGFLHEIGDVHIDEIYMQHKFSMCADTSLDLLVLVSQRLLVIITVNCAQIHIPGSLLGSVNLPIEFDEEVDLCSIWDFNGVVFLVWTSGSSSLYSMCVSKNDTDPDDKTWYPMEDSIGTDINDKLDHSAWISAISSGNGSAFLSGDLTGCLKIWHLETETTPNSGSYINPLFTHESFSPDSITAISCQHGELDSGALFWVADSVGVVTNVQIDSLHKLLHRNRKIVFSHLSGPSSISWNYNASLNYGSIISTSTADGTIHECSLHDSAFLAFRAYTDAVETPGHRNLIRCCYLIPRTPLLVVGENERFIRVWNYDSGILHCSVYADSIPTAVWGVEKGDSVWIVAGFENGQYAEYTLDQILNAEEPSMQEEIGTSVLDMIETTGGIHDVSAHDDESLVLGPREFHLSLAHVLSYSPLCVSDVFCSTMAQYSIICFARSFLILHSSEQRKAVNKLEFDAQIEDIRPVHILRSSDNEGHKDVLFVSILGSDTLQVIDIINSSVVFKFDVGKSVPSFEFATFWIHLHPDKSGASSHEIRGVGYSADASLYNVTSQAAASSSQPSVDFICDCYTPTNDVLNFASGVNSFNFDCAPLFSKWSFRCLTQVKLDLMIESSGFAGRQIVDYKIAHPKCRIINAFSLETSTFLRSHASFVVLSDGTSTIVHFA